MSIYHRDCNGFEIRGDAGRYLVDENGRVYERYDTGAVLPSDPRGKIAVWRHESDPKGRVPWMWVATNKVSIIYIDGFDFTWSRGQTGRRYPERIWNWRYWRRGSDA